MTTATGQNRTTQTQSHRIERSPLVSALLGRHGHARPGSALLVSNRFAVAPAPRGHGRSWSARISVINSVLGLVQVAPLRPQDRRTKVPGRPDFRHRPLAVGHDAVARVVGARPAAHLSRHLRLLRAEPFSRLRLVVSADVADLDALAAADGQHGGRLGPPAGGRVRLVQHGRSLALPDDRLSQSPAAGPGVSRPGGVAARGSAERWKQALPLVPQVPDGAAAEADRVEVAAAHLPRPDAAGDVSQGPVRAHRPQSIRDFSLDDQPLEAALSRPGIAGPDVQGPGGARFRDASSGCTRCSSATAA